MTIVPEEQFAVRLGWAICEYAGGAGIGKCDPLHCVCGPEGLGVAAILYKAGWRMVAIRPDDQTVAITAGERGTS